MMAPHHCAPFRDQFGPHLQGQLPPAQALSLARHLHSCPACRQTLALARQLRALPTPDAPADLAAGVVAQLHAKRARPGWLWSALGSAVSDTAFRALVDPLLRLDLELRDAGAPLRRVVAGAGAELRQRLHREGTNLAQCLALPLLRAGRQVQTALAGSTDTQQPRS